MTPHRIQVSAFQKIKVPNPPEEERLAVAELANKRTLRLWLLPEEMAYASESGAEVAADFIRRFPGSRFSVYIRHTINLQGHMPNDPDARMSTFCQQITKVLQH